MVPTWERSSARSRITFVSDELRQVRKSVSRHNSAISTPTTRTPITFANRSSQGLQPEALDPNPNPRYRAQRVYLHPFIPAVFVIAWQNVLQHHCLKKNSSENDQERSSIPRSPHVPHFVLRYRVPITRILVLGGFRVQGPCQVICVRHIFQFGSIPLNEKKGQRSATVSEIWELIKLYPTFLLGTWSFRVHSTQ